MTLNITTGHDHISNHVTLNQSQKHLLNMKKEIFELRPEDEFIPLIMLLKFTQIAQSGGHAKIMVEEGEVKVNGVQEFQKRKKLRPGDIVELDGITIEISR